MSSGLYVSLSGQIAMQRRLETIANNVANMNTGGFRADEVKFDSLISRAGATPVAYASEGENFVSRRTGAISYTGNPLDVAVTGEAWLAIEGPNGAVYTKDGRFHLSDSGDLLSSAGYPVLDAGGSAITIDPAGGPIAIADDGMITQNGRQLGAIGLFLIPETATLSRFENAGVIPNEEAQPVEDLTVNGVRQGFVEGANVNPVREMTRLIEVTRAFEYAASAMQQQEDIASQSIKTLGPA